jgi:hypothetical protein
LYLFFAAAIQAAPSKGVHAVLMHCWNDSSTTNMIAAIKASAVKELEISFAPFLESRCRMPGNPTGAQADVQRFKSIRRAVKDLAAAGVAVRVVVFLGDIHDTSARSTLGARAKLTWKALMEDDSPTIPSALMLSPSLEDKYPTESEFKRALDKIISGLTESKVAAYGRLALRRNPEGNPTPAITSYPFGSTTLKVRHEVHGIDPHAAQGYNYYSNDGVFVSYNSDTCNSGCKGNPMTMSTYLAKPYKDVELLWRPAYNLARRTGTNYVMEQSPDRADTGSCLNNADACKFDSREIAALKAFLK